VIAVSCGSPVWGEQYGERMTSTGVDGADYTVSIDVPKFGE
jgi:hypothetical protein